MASFDLVTPVGYLVSSKADDITRGAGYRMMWWFDFGGNYFHRPNTVTHLGACLSKNLCTLLSTFTRVGDDLNRMLRNLIDSHIVVSWPVQFYLLPVPEKLKIKVLRLLSEDAHFNIG